MFENILTRTLVRCIIILSNKIKEGNHTCVGAHTV
nr:MAG TPA: hypothetical protein [Bacteriophage sp.]